MKEEADSRGITISERREARIRDLEYRTAAQKQTILNMQDTIDKLEAVVKAAI